MFGLGFAEILFIAVIAVLFLGPDKLPTALIEVAKFLRGVKKTIGTVKDSIEQEVNVADIKEEALAYKAEILKATDEIKEVTDMSAVQSSLSNLNDNFLDDFVESKDKAEAPKELSKELSKESPKESPKEEKITLEKKNV
ncbi:MAG: Sec-independent protein translocase subunit TatB [Sulfurimonas sp.]|nr:Sec-independent protein translocase subunit TatB [Sulfurimonas sp.]